MRLLLKGGFASTVECMCEHLYIQRVITLFRNQSSKESDRCASSPSGQDHFLSTRLPRPCAFTNVTPYLLATILSSLFHHHTFRPVKMGGAFISQSICRK